MDNSKTKPKPKISSGQALYNYRGSTTLDLLKRHRIPTLKLRAILDMDHVDTSDGWFKSWPDYLLPKRILQFSESCWAIATALLLEMYLRIVHQKSHRLSAQNLIDGVPCIDNTSLTEHANRESCYRHSMFQALRFVQLHGIVEENAYEPEGYKGSYRHCLPYNPTCTITDDPVITEVFRKYSMEKLAEVVVEFLDKYKVAGGLFFVDDDFGYYGAEDYARGHLYELPRAYKPKESDKHDYFYGNHYMLVVGVGLKERKAYAKVLNSHDNGSKGLCYINLDLLHSLTGISGISFMEAGLPVHTHEYSESDLTDSDFGF